MAELFRCIWRPVNCRKETAWSVLLSRTMHMVETTIVIEDVGVSAATVHFVHHVCKLAVKVGMRGFCIRNRERPLCLVVLSHTEHFILYLFYFI